MTTEIHPTAEITRAMQFITKIPAGLSIDLWGDKLTRSQQIASDSEKAQRIWANSTEPGRSKATGNLEYVTMMSIMEQFNLFEPEGRDVPKRIPNRGTPIPFRSIPFGYLRKNGAASNLRNPIKGRFLALSQNYGTSCAMTLWGVVMGQVEKGWMSNCIAIDAKTGKIMLTGGPYNIAFRFGARQMGRLRACDVLKRPNASLACAAGVPLKLPTLGHVAQICPPAGTGPMAWSCSKAANEIEYKTRPVDHTEENMAVVALRALPPPNGWT